MGSRYWVGGTASWDATAGTKWALTSGGAGGQAVPTSSDDVFFDANSTGTCTVAAASDCLSLDFSGHTGTFAGTSSLNMYGNLDLGSGANTWTHTGILYFKSASGTKTIWSRGKQIKSHVYVTGGGTFQLQDDAIWHNGATDTSSYVSFGGSTLDINGKTLTVSEFDTSGNNGTIAWGTNGKIDIIRTTGTWAWYDASTAVITNTGTGTIELTGNTSSERRFSHNNNYTSIPVVVSAGSGLVTISGNMGTYTQTSGYTGSCAFGTTYPPVFLGNFTMASANGNISGAEALTFAATTGTKTITTAGNTIDCPITFDGAGGAWQLVDGILGGATRLATLTRGTLDLNGQTFTVGLFSSSNSNTRVLTFGAGTLNLTGVGTITPLDLTTTTGLTLNIGTGTIELSGATGSTRTIQGGSKALPSLKYSGGSGIITLTNVASILDFTMTSGYTGALANTALTIKGSVSLNAANGTPTAGANAWTFAATSGTKTIATAGKTLDFPLVFDGVGGTWQLASALTLGSTRNITLTNGTFDSNDYGVNAAAFVSSNSNTRTVDLGASTWVLSATGDAWDCGTSTGLTVTPGTSVIGLTSTTAPAFDGGNKTYYDMYFPVEDGAYEIRGSNTFRRLFLYNPIPPDILDLAAAVLAGGTSLRLTWTNPAIGDLQYVHVRRATGATPPATVGDGTQVYQGTAQTVDDTGLTTGQQYSYSIWVRDNADQWSAGKDTVSATPVNAANYTEDFEADTTGWTFVNGTEVNKWTWGTAQAAAGSKGVYISNDSGTTAAYTITDTAVTHIYADYVLPSTPTTLYLHFEVKCGGEGSGTAYDYGFVSVCLSSQMTPVVGTNNTTYRRGDTYISSPKATSSTATWTQKSIDLSSLGYVSGDTLRITFTWVNDSSVGTQPGMCIDNVAINESATPPGF